MTTPKKNMLLYVSTLLLITCIIIFIYLTQNTTHKETRKKYKLNEFVDHAQFVTYSRSGQVRLRVTATRINHYHNLSKFFSPIAMIYTKSGTPWKISSQTATSKKNGKSIHFSGDVIIEEIGLKQIVITRITTTKLTVYPSRSFASTNQPVRVNRDNMTLTGVGLEADLKLGKYKIIKDAKAHFIPH